MNEFARTCEIGSGQAIESLERGWGALRLVIGVGCIVDQSASPQFAYSLVRLTGESAFEIREARAELSSLVG